ncbi:MAG: glutathione S-transferase N-terminal domain-containing protein [Pseudomonadota bacterium]
MTVKLYDLCGADPAIRFSPPCWLVKFTLLHKGMPFETVPLRFDEKENYPDPDYGRLPIIVDGGKTVTESRDILLYLDDHDPKGHRLLDGRGRAQFDFINGFAISYLYPSLAPKLFLHVHNAIDPRDKAYFREDREKRLGITLEEAADKDVTAPLATALKTLDASVRTTDWFHGDEPGAADFALGSIFIWERMVKRDPVVEKPDALGAWFERTLNLFDGYARKAPRAT